MAPKQSQHFSTYLCNVWIVFTEEITEHGATISLEENKGSELMQIWLLRVQHFVVVSCKKKIESSSWQPGQRRSESHTHSIQTSSRYLEPQILNTEHRHYPHIFYRNEDHTFSIRKTSHLVWKQTIWWSTWTKKYFVSPLVNLQPQFHCGVIWSNPLLIMSRADQTTRG